jgi:hypothetical protein
MRQKRIRDEARRIVASIEPTNAAYFYLRTIDFSDFKVKRLANVAYFENEPNTFVFLAYMVSEPFLIVMRSRDDSYKAMYMNSEAGSKHKESMNLTEEEVVDAVVGYVLDHEEDVPRSRLH